VKIYKRQSPRSHQRAAQYMNAPVVDQLKSNRADPEVKTRNQGAAVGTG
jgi:hypothetical protein